MDQDLLVTRSDAQVNCSLALSSWFDACISPVKRPRLRWSSGTPALQPGTEFQAQCRNYVTYHDRGYSTRVTAQRLVRTGRFRRFDRWESRGSQLETRNPLRRCEIYLATLAGPFFMLSDPGFCLPILAPLAGTRRR